MASRERRPLTRLERVLENFAKTKAGGWWFVNVANKLDPPLLKATRGRFSTAIGSPILLLRSRGCPDFAPPSTLPGTTTFARIPTSR